MQEEDIEGESVLSNEVSEISDHLFNVEINEVQFVDYSKKKTPCTTDPAIAKPVMMSKYEHYSIYCRSYANIIYQFGRLICY